MAYIPPLGFAQIVYKNGQIEAFKIEKGPSDFNVIGRTLLSKKDNVAIVTLFNVKLEVQGVYK